MSEASRKRSASVREDGPHGQAPDGWEPATKRLRTLVHQMRSLSLGDMPWSRRADAAPPPSAGHGSDAAPPPPDAAADSGGTASAAAASRKRSDDEPCGNRTKKARNRMRLAPTGVAITSCYIEQTLYT